MKHPAFSERRAFEIVPFPKPGKSSGLRFAASILSGILLFACFPRLDWNLLVWMACAPLLAAVVSERNLARAFLLGYLSGGIFLAGSCYWFVGVMQRYGGLGPGLATGVLALFVIVFAVFYGVLGLVEAWVARFSLPMAFALSSFLWVALELARTYYVEGGFPWNLLGYAVQAVGLRQCAAYTAVYGLSFLAVATSALLAWNFLEPRRKGLRPALIAWLVLLAAANWMAAPSSTILPSHEAYLVQLNIPLDEPAAALWAPWRDPASLERLVSMTESVVAKTRHEVRHGVSGGAGDEPAQPSLFSNSQPFIIWPENPAPFFFERDPVFRSAIQKMAGATRSYVVVGTVTFLGGDEARPQNSAVVLDPEGRLLLHYAKIHLVPFGEYVPGWAFPGRVGKITAGVGNFVPGSGYGVAGTPEGKIGVFICYEAIFPQLVRRFVSAGAEVLVNISNDAWFGDSSAPFQHLAMARLRAIENHRFLLRATNDGITTVIDPFGRIMAELPRHERAVLPGHFDFLSRRTFYSAHGDVFAWLSVMVTVALVVRRALARPRGPEFQPQKERA